MDLDYTVSLPLCLTVVPSLYLQLYKIFSTSLLISLINSCSVNSCNFGVPMEGGELRVFLFHHLGHQPDPIYFQMGTSIYFAGDVLHSFTYMNVS